MATSLPHPRVWFITGSSTGFGRALAEAVLAHGDRLVATARHPEGLQDLVRSSPDRVQLLPLDVTDPHQSQDAAAQAVEHFGRIEVASAKMGKLQKLLKILSRLLVPEASTLRKTHHPWRGLPGRGTKCLGRFVHVV